MVVRTLRDIHKLYFLAGTMCLHFYPQIFRCYASINVLFAYKSNNILLLRLKNINKFVYMQFLSYICRQKENENDKDTVYMSWQYLPVGDGRNGDETFVQKCR